MKGKTKEEAKVELEKSGMQGETLERILPHKVFKVYWPQTHFASLNLICLSVF